MDSHIAFYGLVLAGGKSTRMTKDKAALEYHGQSQIEYCFDLLKNYCDAVFLSCREDQGRLEVYRNFPQIHDLTEYQDIGPLGGMISAMTRHPAARWIVLATDLPHLDAPTIENLIIRQNKNKIAAAYASATDGLPEPLCAIYQPNALQELIKSHKNDVHCPRKVLINSDVELLKLINRQALDNVNDPETYQQTLQQINKDKKVS